MPDLNEYLLPWNWIILLFALNLIPLVVRVQGNLEKFVDLIEFQLVIILLIYPSCQATAHNREIHDIQCATLSLHENVNWRDPIYSFEKT